MHDELELKRREVQVRQVQSEARKLAVRLNNFLDDIDARAKRLGIVSERRKQKKVKDLIREEHER